MIHKLFAVASRMYRSVKPVRSDHYKTWVRSWPCIACGTIKRAREAMHIGPHGISQKASDLDCLPGCYKCHAELHRLGPVRFQMLHNLDFREAIEVLQHMYALKFGRLPGGEERRAA